MKKQQVNVRHQQNTIGAIILGSDFKALGIVRSLGKRGIPSVLIDNTPRSAWFSRYVVKRFLWHGPMEGITFLSFLLTLNKTHCFEQWILFPSQDDVVEFVARNNRELAKVYRLVTQEWNIVQWAHDKRLMHRLAQEVGIPYPKTWYPTNENDIYMLEITFPVIIKPAISIHLQHTLHLKALPAYSYEELLWQYRIIAGVISTDEIMIQEIIPGSGCTQYSVAAFCKGGQTLLSMTARRTRQYPIDYGLGSSFVEAIEVPALFELAKKLLFSMELSGMVEVEFKYDLRDGEYKLLDINPRPWGWHTLCMACGLDFPSIQYDDVLGKAQVNITPHYGYRWVRLLTDIPAGIQEIRARIITPWAYIHSLMGKIVFSVFDLHDPLPALGDVAITFVRLTQQFFKRIERTVR